MTRNEAREISMQILFELDASKAMTIEDVSRLTDLKLAGNHKKRGKTILSGIINNVEEVDALIEKTSTSWHVNRIPKVDLAILRLAIGEMNYSEDIPTVVSINEAVNIAKKYSTEQSSKFINGILRSIVKEKGSLGGN